MKPEKGTPGGNRALQEEQLHEDRIVSEPRSFGKRATALPDVSEGADAFRIAIASALGYAPAHITGQFQRFATSTRRGDMSGWAKFLPGCAAGVFGDFRQGVAEVWTHDIGMSRERRMRIAREVALATIERLEHQPARTQRRSRKAASAIDAEAGQRSTRSENARINPP